MYKPPFSLFDPFTFPPIFSPPPPLPAAPPLPSPELHYLDLLLNPSPLDLPFHCPLAGDLDLSDHLQISSSWSSFNSFQQRAETELAIKTLGDRVAALELGLLHRSAAAKKVDRKFTWTAEYNGPKDLGLDRKYKWVAETKGSGDKTAKWVAEIRGLEDEEVEGGGVDRKYKWLAVAKRNGVGDVKWSAEFKGKGKYAPVSRTYTWKASTAAAASAEDYDEDDLEKTKKKKKSKSKNGKSVQLVEIEENNPSRATIAIRKAFAQSSNRGKKKELSPQDAALLIQMSYRAHLVRRAQVLRCLRSLAVAKAKLKEIRALFANFHYRSRIMKDAEELQRFSEKIIVLLLTVDAIEGPDYLVRVAKKSMIEELEAMLEVVDPQPPGKLSSMKRRKFDLPVGPISKEMMAGVAEVVQMLEDE